MDRARVRTASEGMLAFGGFALVAVAPLGLLKFQFLSPEAQVYYAVLAAGAAVLVSLGILILWRPVPRVALVGAGLVTAVLLVNQVLGVWGDRILCFGPT